MTRKTKNRLIVFTAILSCMYIISYVSGVFNIRQIECFTQFGPCPDNYSEAISWLGSRSLLLPLHQRKIRRQLDYFSEINSVRLYRRLPSTLVLGVAVKRPIAALGPDILGTKVTVDETGYILGQTSSTTLPYLYSSLLPEISSVLDSYQTQASIILSQLASLTPHRITGSLSGTALTIGLYPNLEVVVDVTQPVNNWYSPLQFILSRSKIMAKMPRRIDLRFTDPVVTD